MKQHMQHDIFLKESHALRWVKKTRPTEKKLSSTRKIRFIDIFSGCGGLSLGIESAGKDRGVETVCALAVDANKPALDVYRNNINHEKNALKNSDIVTLLQVNSTGRLTKKEKTLKEDIGKIDILVAGPPCQGHSDLNNSTRRNDPRNNLYLACIRAIEIFEPDLVLIENVPTVVHSTEGVVQSTLERLRKKNYFVSHQTVNFLDLGIPQSRRRHILLASRNSKFGASLTTKKNRTQRPVLRDFISNLKDEDGLISKSGKLSLENVKRVEYLFENKLYDLPDTHRPPCHRDKQHSYNSVYGRLDYEQPAQTLTSGYGSMGQGRYIHPAKKRTINSREAARIQGFPDFYDFSSVDKLTELRKMIANAVPPQLSYTVVLHYINTHWCPVNFQRRCG